MKEGKGKAAVMRPLLLASVFLSVFLFWWKSSQPEKPNDPAGAIEFEGRTLESWFRERCNHIQPHLDSGVDAIRYFDTNAVPFLIRAYLQPEIHSFAKPQLVRSAALQMLHAIKPPLYCVERAISDIVPDNRQSFPVHLLNSTRDERVRAVQIAVTAFTNGGFPTRLAAARAMAGFGDVVTNALPIMIENMARHQYSTELMIAIGNCGLHASNAIPALEKIVQDETGITRFGAALAIARVDPSRTDMAEIIRTNLLSTDKEHLWKVRRVLGQLRGRVDVLLPILEELTEDIGTNEALELTSYIRRLAPELVIRRYEQVMDGPSKYFRRTWAAHWVLKMDRHNKHAIKRLIQLAESLPANTGKDRAIYALGAAPPGSESVKECLNRFLKNPHQRIREMAQRSLGQIHWREKYGVLPSLDGD